MVPLFFMVYTSHGKFGDGLLLLYYSNIKYSFEAVIYFGKWHWFSLQARSFLDVFRCFCRRNVWQIHVGFLTRYGQKAPPTRIAAKIKMAAALLKELQFWNITICVGCWLFGFWCGYFVHVWKPVSFFPIPHYWTRSLELFQAWYTIHISHSDVAWYWESLSGIPILAPGATVVFAAVCKKFLKSHILELMWVGGIFQRMMAGMDF